MNELKRVVAQAFGVPEDSLSAASSNANTPGWDSVGHLNLVLNIEEHFQVRFTTEEIAAMTDLAAIQNLLDNKNHGS